MKDRIVRYHAVLLGAFLACAPAPEQAPSTAAAPTPAEPGLEIVAAAVDAGLLAETAYRLAGLPAEQDGAVSDGVWTQHAEEIDSAWQRLEEGHLNAMRSWAKADLALAQPSAPLIYPFSGPDLPNALQLFPQAASYVLVGLEAPGKIPDLSLVGDDQLAAELGRLRTGLVNLVEAGYFVTKRMETDFVAPHLEGVLPVLYLFLARFGTPPTAVRFISLDADGSPRPLETVTESQAKAVELDFEVEGEPRKLYYFSQDLSNGALAAAPEMTAFLARQGAFNTYMKSASYLLHMEGFTTLKTFLLEHAGAVVQDDSGIPVRDLAPTDWERRFFGTYTTTLPTYREWYQDDLRALYERDDVRPLPFAIGYNSRIGGSCLIWAQRRER